MSFKITGLDKLTKKLEDLQGPHDGEVIQLFEPSFMNEYSNFNTFQDFADKSGFDWNNIESIDNSELDTFVSANTTFKNWSSMMNKAAELGTVKKWNS